MLIGHVTLRQFKAERRIHRPLCDAIRQAQLLQFRETDVFAARTRRARLSALPTIHVGSRVLNGP